MDRKKIILLAVAINASLLILLFLVALYREEEVPAGGELAHQFSKESPALLFEGSPLTEELPKPLPFEPPASSEIVHQLPPLQQESPPALVQAQPLAPAPPILEVVVKKGDTLDKIAKAHQVALDEILRLNQLSSTFLRVGQVLKLPASKQTTERPAPQAAAQSEYYIVKVGDTPWTIAMKYRMKPEELLRLNHLNQEKAKKLKPGDRLRVR